MICQFCGYEFDGACGKYGCPNCNGEGLEDMKAPYDQVAADRRYRAGQKARGIVRKSVLVPENRVQELQAMLKQWRAEA